MMWAQGNPIVPLQAGREDLAVKLNNAMCSCTLSDANWEINPFTEANNMPVAVLSYRPLILNRVPIATLLLFEHRRKSVYHILRITNGMPKDCF